MCVLRTPPAALTTADKQDLAKLYVDQCLFLLCPSSPGFTTPPVPDAQLSKARKVATAVGVAAGGFGSMLGVGGGVLIAPVIANACK